MTRGGETVSASNSQHDNSRRRFLKGMAIGGTVAGVAGSGSALAVTRDGDGGVAAPVDDSKTRGYRETTHVRRFYDSARG